MKILSFIKKSLVLVMALFSVFALVFISNNEVYAITETGNATYNVTSSTESNSLPYGIEHVTHRGVTTKANGTKTYEQQVNVLDIPSLTGVKVISWANTNNNVWTLTSVRKLAKDYESKNPGYKVVAAINADFFDINGNGNLKYQTNGVHVAEGNFYKTTATRTIGFTNDGSTKTLIANKTLKRTDAMVLAVYDDSNNIIAEYDVLNLNKEPQDGEASVYFGQYNSTHRYETQVVPEVSGAQVFTIENAEKALPNNAEDFYGLGVISSNKAIELGVGQFSIVSKNSEINSALSIGKRIRLQYEFVGEYANIDSATGGGVCVLKDFEAPSNIETALDAVHPRTGIGMKEDGSIVMVVIDGRQESKGMNGVGGASMSAIMKNYGCKEAYNLDGGGSSTLCILEDGELQVKNSPSDGWERSDSNCLLVVVKDPEFNVQMTKREDKIIGIKVDLINANGHTYDKLYAAIGTQEVEVIDGYAEFSKLKALTKYQVKLYYKNSLGKKLLPMNGYEVSTSAIPYKFRGVDIIETDSSYEIEIDYLDRGKATNLATATIIINDKEYTLSDGKVIVLKEDIGKFIYDMKLIFTNTDIDGIETVTLINPHSNLIGALQIIYEEYSFILIDIYS